MLVSEFDYELPPELIAQLPLEERDASRLLRLDRTTGTWQDGFFRELPNILRENDLLIMNNTRVFPARLYGRRCARGGGQRLQGLSSNYGGPTDFLEGRIEVLLTHQLSEDPNEWECLVKPGRKIRIGEKLYFGHALGAPESSFGLEAEVIGRGDFGERRIRFDPVLDFFDQVERIGRVPLPPYIRRGNELEGSDSDKERYQTVFAQARGSAAAPTAGLHFTKEIIERIRDRGIETAEITLHVGLGTFQPVRVENVEGHRLHRERYEIAEDVAQAINRAKHDGRRVIAVGTTTVRTLEYVAEKGAQSGRNGGETVVEAGGGDADIFIYPGYKFRIVDAILTNFHLPQSTLLMLVCAFAGKEAVMNAYLHAIARRYRFYSYGDCMLIE
jgi:S-adenosylmethionine:tRNA ribosyltransferase-isomerase